MKVLVIRYGAIGDMIIITPLLRFLKGQGHEVYLHTSEIGMKVLANNPSVHKFLPYESNSVPDSKLQEHWAKIAKENGCEATINLCESIERALALHPMDPPYNWTKAERHERCNRNFYEYTFEHAEKECVSLFEPKEEEIESWLEMVRGEGFHRPELFFTREEEMSMQDFFKPFAKEFVIVWGLSGSALNKNWPYTDFVIGDLLRTHDNVRIITVGDEMCQILETMEHKRVVRKSGKWSIRESALACKHADLVIAPDTGLLHAAGCFDTPKIGLIGSNTIENLTKHFVNDFSLEADSEAVPCAPCHRIIYSASAQCPIEQTTSLPMCMSLGIDPKRVLDQIERIINASKDNAGHSLQSVRETSQR